MGIFTWTLANKPLRRLRSGDYAASCKLRYDGYGAVVCPDNTLLQEACYQGYGIFAGHDIYEDVVDWNKAHLTEIPQHPGFKHCFPLEENAACIAALNAFANNDEEGLRAAVAAMFGSPAMRAKWKRRLGIYIAGGGDNALLPYPIKIVNCSNPAPYDRLPPSLSTQ